MNKRFKSVDGKDKRIALLSGHVFIVGKDWCPLPELAHSAAYATQCISEDMVFHKAVEEKVTNPEMPEALQETKIDSDLLEEKAKGLALAKKDVYDFLKTAVEDSTPGVFSKNGKVMVMVVQKKMGVSTPTSVIQEAWAELKNDLEN